MDVTKSFKEDWDTAFPGVNLPNLSFLESKDSIEKEIVDCGIRINELKFQLQKQEFILNKLTNIQNDQASSKSLESPTAIADQDNTQSLSSTNSSHNVPEKPSTDETLSSNFEVLDIYHNENDTNEISTFSSFKPEPKSPKTSISQVGKESQKQLSETNNKAHQKSFSMDEKQLNFQSNCNNISGRRATDPSIEEPKPKPRPAPRTLPRGRKAPLPPPSDKNRSLSMTDVSTRSNKKSDLPPVLLSKTQSMNLEELSLSPRLHHQQTDIVFNEEIESSKIPNDSKEEKAKEKEFVDPYEDDEHIYTDIDELNIKRERLPTPPELEKEPDERIIKRNQASLYENTHIKPKIKKLVDNEIYDVPSESENPFEKLQCKRLGSNDRQAMIIPDEKPKGHLNAGQIEILLNNSTEYSVDDDIQNNTSQEMVFGDDSSFEIVEEEEEDSDDEEHIYANVDDLRIFPKSDEEDDDHDILNDSMMGDLPSPHYREMTSDQIQSMLEKIQESDDDIQNSQGTATNNY